MFCFYINRFHYYLLNRDISVKASTEKLENMNYPTITLCFHPFAKLSTLKYYNISFNEFKYAKINTNLSIPWLEFYGKVSYKIGTDFNISVTLTDEAYSVFIDKRYLDPPGQSKSPLKTRIELKFQLCIG